MVLLLVVIERTEAERKKEKTEERVGKPQMLFS